MIKAFSLAVAVAGLGVAFLSPASAEMRFDPGLNTIHSQPVIQAQYRRGYYGRGYYGRGYGGRGAGVAAGIAGLAAGAIIGGALAAQAQPAYPVYPAGDAVAYCLNRFKSYDPRSGTYLGFDGYRHPCP